jgi:hypothetical protein
MDTGDDHAPEVSRYIVSAIGDGETKDYTLHVRVSPQYFSVRIDDCYIRFDRATGEFDGVGVDA